MNTIQTTTLSNGLRAITDRIDTVHSVAIGIWVGVGTRNEDMAHNGAAHMVEHMLFKGTPSRSSQDIAEALENVGGHMNAYTSREVTSYHAHVLKGDAPLALEVLADMVQNSTLPDHELARERDVILQEIGMCNDTPDDVVFDYYFETAWQNQAIGAPILGTADIVKNMTKATLSQYIESHYTPKNMVISAAGNIDHDVVTAAVERLFTSLPKDQDIRCAPADYNGGIRTEVKPLEQIHVIEGYRAPARNDEPRFFAAKALATILGGGMSSRLFQEVREKRGLAYAVYAFYSAYRDDGTFGIYTGTAPDKVSELMPVITREIEKISDNVTDAELLRAKAQLKTGVLMGRESMMSRADQNAKHLLYRNRVLDIDGIIQTVDAINAAAIKNVANDIFGSKKTQCTLGPAH